MAFIREIDFGGPVAKVLAGFYPFELQIWAFAGNDSTNSSNWILNLQAYARFTEGHIRPTHSGFDSTLASVKLFGTDNVTIDTNQQVMSYNTPVTYEMHSLPMHIAANVLDGSAQNILLADHIQFTISSSGANEPISVQLVDMQFQTTLNLLGTTEVVVIDPIF